LSSGLAFADGNNQGDDNDQGDHHHHSAPAPLVGAGVAGAITVAGVAVAACLRQFRKSRKG
jgi:hypothetical protein